MTYTGHEFPKNKKQEMWNTHSDSKQQRSKKGHIYFEEREDKQ